MVKVACCWDDGVVNDIRLIEILRKYNAKATFNLNPGLHSEDREKPRWVAPGEGGFRGFVNGKVGLKELKEIYGNFQVASHGWTHKNAGMCPDEEFFKDAMDARHFLEDLFQRECPGYAWPCGRYTDSTAKLLQDAGFRYARTTEYTTAVGKTDAPMRLKSNCHFLDQGFWQKFLDAKASGNIFYFWGHSYELMDCEGLWRHTEQKFAMLAEDPEVQWIDVIDIVNG